MPVLPRDLPAYHVEVKFGKGIPSSAQGVALLEMERHLRELTRHPVEVYKEMMGDDSKLRSNMTPEQRAKL